MHHKVRKNRFSGEVATSATSGGLVGSDGTRWERLELNSGSTGRLAAQNVCRRQPGPTAYATARISLSDPVSAFRVLFCESMIRRICRCTTAEGNRVTPGWSIDRSELDKFFAL